MKENDVAYISEQFGLEPEIVQASINDGTLSVRLKDSLSTKKIYNDDEFKTLLNNHADEVRNAYFNELVDGSKKGNVPQEIYKPVNGAVRQQIERELSKKYNIAEFNDLHDLVDRVVQTSANSKTPPDIEQQINELKQANLRLKEEKDNAVKTVADEYKTKFIDKEKSTALDRVPFDFTDYKADEVDTVRLKTKTILKSVFDSEYKLDYDEKGRLIVRKGESIIKDEATREPVSVENVLLNLAKEYNMKIKSPDRGGQGGQSSTQSNGLFGSVQEFNEWCDKKGIASTSREALDMYRKSGLHNK